MTLHRKLTQWEARRLVGRGVSVIELDAGHKRPLPGKSWQRYQTCLPTFAELDSWRDGANLGIVTGSISNLAVIDCESQTDADWFSARLNKPTNNKYALTQTPRGYHFFFRHPGNNLMNATQVKRDGRTRYDIRGDGGFIVAPPSKVTQQDGVKQSGVYRWIIALGDTNQLSLFDRRWEPDRTAEIRKPKAETTPLDDPEGVIRAATAYINKIHARSGDRGHDTTFRAVAWLKDFGLDVETARDVIAEWNQTNADPPWSERELEHKLRSVFSD